MRKLLLGFLVASFILTQTIIGFCIDKKVLLWDNVAKKQIQLSDGTIGQALLTDGSGQPYWGSAGYTNLTSFVSQTAWRLFYSNGSGDVTELALGADGTYLKSNGATSAPTFQAGVISIASPTEGDLLWYHNSEWTVLPIGTTGQTLQVINGYASQYPTQDATHVKATSNDGANYLPHLTTDPTKSLTGAYTANQWSSSYGTNTNQRFHIDLGTAKIITKVYYENAHNSGTYTNMGAKNFTFWGSNEASAFAELTYGTDTNWTQLTTDPTQMVQHTGSDIADPQYITVTNTTAYRYYAFKFADNWGYANNLGVRRIELQLYQTVGWSD